MKELNIPEGYYSEKQVSDMLGKTIASLRVDHCRRSDIVPPKTKIGTLIIYSKKSFQEWLESKEVKTSFDKQGRRCR